MPEEPAYANSASNRANLTVSEGRLRRYQPEMFGLRGLVWCIRKLMVVRWTLSECMKYGDARAAIVWSLRPLQIAAYSDEFDAVLMLRFPEAIADEFSFSEGQRLIAVNGYGMRGKVAKDIVAGPNAVNHDWTNFAPTIAEIFSDDTLQIQELHRAIPDSEWERCTELATACSNSGRARNGLPLFADCPVT